MTVYEWFEQQICDARNAADAYEVAAGEMRVRCKTLLEVRKHLPVEQMKTQIAGEGPAKE